MKKRNLIILGIICVVIIIGISVYLLLRREEPVPNNDVITRIIEREEREEEIIIIDPPPFQPIMTPFCAEFINEEQFREIIKHRDDLFFEDTTEYVPEVGALKICNIFIADPVATIIEGEMLEVEIKGVSMVIFPLEFSYEQAKQMVLAELVEEEPELKDEIKEIDNVGAKAFGASGEGFHFIIFLEPDTNQVIEVGVEGFTYDVLIELARQIEMNVR